MVNISNEQPEALLLADAFEAEFAQGRISNRTGRKAAAELRRLYAENDAAHAVGIRQEQTLMDDEALMQQCLEALELRCGTHADKRNKLIPALRKRLGY